MNQSTANGENQAPPDTVSHKAVALVQFASLAFMTQGVLLLNQIVLLPIQIRVWGTETSAYWYSIMALAAVTSAADFGLRTAGHAELIRHANDPNDHEARSEFQQLWAWIRILIATTTVLLVVADFFYHHVYRGVPYPLWRPALVVGIALEVLLGVRITYLDSQGLYREAEAGYLVLAAARLILAVSALLIFHSSPVVLAWIWFFTGLFAIMQQSRLCHRIGRLRLFEPIPPDLSFRTLATVRHTMADPCSTWVRFQGPVVVLSVFAAPIAIVTYVALRAVFGAARQTISQLSRYASVEYLALRQARKFELAEMHLCLMVLLTAFFASVVAALVVVDNGRLASLVLNKMDLPIYLEVAITFGLGNAFYTHQLLQAVSRRSGEVVQVARRQYFYMICAAVFAVIALALKSTLLWLSLMLLAEVLVALSFMLRPPSTSILSQTSAGWRGSLAAAASSVLIFTMWLVMHLPTFTFTRGRSTTDVICTIAFFLMSVLLIGVVDLCLVYGLRVAEMSLPGALIEWVQRIRAAKLQNE